MMDDELKFEDYYALLEQHDKVISERHKAGESFRSIAQDFGISISAAQQAAKSWEWDITQRNLAWQREIASRRDKGKSYEEIAIAMNHEDAIGIEYLDTRWRRRLKARRRAQFKKQVIEYGYA